MPNFFWIIALLGCLATSPIARSASCDPATFPPGVAQLTHGPLAGAVTATSAKIGFRTDAKACVQIKYATNDLLWGAVVSDAKLTRGNHDFTGNIEITGLARNTIYYYTIVVNGVDTAAAPVFRFKTFPDVKAAVPFTFGILSDLDSKATAPAMAALAADSPDFVVILGDYDHRNPQTLAEMRAMHREVREEAVSGPDLRDHILRQFPVAHVWDDHDYGPNNGDKTFAAKTDALKAFDEYWPSYTRPRTKQGLWHKFEYGSLAEVYILDLRYQRDASTDPDDVNKSMLDGNNIRNGQKAWLLDSLRRSTATWKFIASTVTWNPTVAKEDAWYGFRTEQQELVNFIRTEGITGVVFFSGDIHSGGAIDDGTNAIFPELNVPHTNKHSDNTTCGHSDQCGFWSAGFDPGGGGYGLVSVSPQEVRLQTKDDLGTERFSLTIPAPAPTARSDDADTSTNAGGTVGSPAP